MWNILESVSQIAHQRDHFESNVNVVCKRVQLLAHKVHDLKNCRRRNNVIVYGAAEDEVGTPNVLRKRVIEEIFQRKLWVKVKSLERIHRLRLRKSEKLLLVILRLFDFNEKNTDS